ncbi:MAG: GNAT family N-acetyltransferase [Betaproteobacteria bacterium]|nr:GNAT family N-acetyltransferase [Betaproteobacteria bacterium]
MTSGAAFRPEWELPGQLIGDRILLRPYRPGDGAALFAAIDGHRAELGKWLGWLDQHRTPDDAEAYVRRMHAKWLERSALILAIWSKDGREYFGGTGFHAFNWTVPSFELGYFLRPDAQGHGYASEAVRLVVDFGFKSLAARRIWASCDVQNERSVRVLERCGFAREGTLKNERRNLQGGLRDTLLFALTTTP